LTSSAHCAANPSGTNWYGYSGTAASCGAFAFLRVFSAEPMAMYNATLSVYYLLLIRFKFSEFGMRKVEPNLLLVPFLWGLGTSIATMVQGLHGPDTYVTGVCTLGPPPGCTGSDCQLRQVDAIRFSLRSPPIIYLDAFPLIEPFPLCRQQLSIILQRKCHLYNLLKMIPSLSASLLQQFGSRR